ncbi:wax ester synthase/diacylglycerol acyltransferase 11-like [Cornus florida]|uniref:wax ester synthase/diacylglycerol acyltransferase 11-like n=1 Tax=Cornus florida TaxID=4283 RepID=UPI00289E0A19|nr:wax ester synthase/diacylglycerol acyltransferase 11-like [Cornus florida]
MDKISSGLGVLKPIQTGKVDGEETAMVMGEPLSPIARVFHEPGSNIHIITIIGWKSKVNLEVLKANMIQIIVKHPRFSSMQVRNKENGGEIKWIPTNVDLDNHIIIPDLDQNMESSDKFVEDYVSNLSTTTIDTSKPVWEFHHLDVETSDAKAVSVLRAHHSIGDGTSLISLLLSSTHKASDPKALPTSSVTKRSKGTHYCPFFSIFNMVWNTVIGVVTFMLAPLFLKDTDTPLKAPPGAELNARRFVHRSVSLDDIKLVKNSMNTTINDVVVGVTQAALTRYLNRRYGEGKNIPEKKNYLPKDIRFRAIFFFNLRPAGGIPAFVDMIKSKEERWGNKIGIVLLPLRIGFQEGPLDYVRDAKLVMDRKKASLEANFAYFSAKLVIKFFGSKVAGILSRKLFSCATMWFSNLAGPKEEIAFCGYPIAYIAPSCYGQPNALLIHAMSYADKMTFVLSADEATIPDPHQLCDDLEDSLKLIKNATLQDGVMNC